MQFILLILKNAGRNLIRTVLTALGTMVLVLAVTSVWSILAFLDNEMAHKSEDLKVIVSERWQLPSQMPYSYASTLIEGAAREPGDVRPLDSMTWQFFGGSTESEPRNRNMSNMVFAFALEPKKLLTMMDELDELPPGQKAEFAQTVARLENNRQGLIVGRDRLKAIDKKVGERITLHGLNYRDIDLEFEIVGEFPPSRYDSSAAMGREYLNNALDVYERERGQKHPLAERTLNLVWLRVRNMEDFHRITQQIENSPLYRSPAVKCETRSSGVATFLEAYRDIIWGMRWLLGPAIVVTLSLVIANAISLSVRERRVELAVMKVLGFRPYQLLILVLGEAVLIGVLAGLACGVLCLVVINHGFGGLKLPFAFFSAFYIPVKALWWGPAVGGGAALVGSFFPAWSAGSVRVSEVFSKIA
jgi:putative ABC transport system permease protein